MGEDYLCRMDSLCFVRGALVQEGFPNLFLGNELALFFLSFLPRINEGGHPSAV